MIGYIYYLQNDATNEIFYIGSSFNPIERFNGHKSNSRSGDTLLYKFISLNVPSFSLHILEEIEVDTRKELIAVEKYWIHQFKAWGFELKNTVFYKYTIKEPSLHDKPFAVRLGELKPILQAEAFELNISMHSLILQILDIHLQKSCLKRSA